MCVQTRGLAANFIARIPEKHRWVAYVGLLIILYVAVDVSSRGASDPACRKFGPLPRPIRLKRDAIGGHFRTLRVNFLFSGGEERTEWQGLRVH